MNRILTVALALASLCFVVTSHAQEMISPSEYLRDAKFKPVYFKALGAKSTTPWLTEMDGPNPLMKKVQVDGSEYEHLALCKNRDCGDNNAVLLYSPSKGVVYGTIYEKGKVTLIGNPPAGVAAELPKLWKKEFRSQS